MSEAAQKIFTVNLPDIGEGVVEGEVIEWLKQPNDTLKQDEAVVVVMTDKATVELPAPYPGKLHKQYYSQGQIAIKDQPLYDIVCDDLLPEILPENNEKKTKPLEIKHPPSEVAKQPQGQLHQKIPHGKALAAPPTRKLARELGVDINQITPSLENGIILRADVIKFHANSASPKPEKIANTLAIVMPDDEEIPLIGIRNLMAKRMSESKRLIPHFSYFEQIDATHLVQLRKKFKEEAAKQHISVTYMPFLIKALSLSLKQYPYVNSSVDAVQNKIILHKQHNVGIAINTEKGLIVPVLKNVQLMKLVDVIQRFEELKERALRGKLQPLDMKDATITISNFGVLGGEGLWATPIINYPEVAILAVSKIHKEAVVKNSAIAVRDSLNLSWSFDHRVIDGDMAASFSHYFGMLVQNPAPLI